jgi:hypothetical protein
LTGCPWSANVIAAEFLGKLGTLIESRRNIMDVSPRPPFPPIFVSLRPDLKVALRPDISLSGGRSGEKVKFLKGPPHSALKSVVEGRVFVTNAVGQVVLDITAERVKQVIPQVGFVGEKRDSTAEELDLIKQLWK